MGRIGVVVSLSLSLWLVACGGDGDDDPALFGAPNSSMALAQICSAENPYVDKSSQPTWLGGLADERNWVKAYLDERYLWYADMPFVNAKDPRYNTTGEFSYTNSMSNYYYDLLNPKTDSVTGQKIDQFSFVTSTDQWNGFSSGSDQGFAWLLSRQGRAAERRIWVSYVFPSDNPRLAKGAGIERGDEILKVNGDPVNSVTAATRVDEALSPRASDVQPRSFLVKKKNGDELTVSLTPGDEELPQVEYKVLTANGQKWGYLLFNSHIEPAQTLLQEALREFKTQSVTQLVLDLRYNGGGLLALASALSYAVAGPVQTQGKTFERLLFNDKRSLENFDLPFYNTDLDGRPIDFLGLNKIYALTTDQTCSASESIINGLRGIDVEVVQIGGTTCGKPYGFMPQDNCGLTFAAMEFKGVNDKNFGDFSRGFSPRCAVSDDLSFALGDPREGMLATAISLGSGLERCVSLAASRALGSGAGRGWGSDAKTLIRQEWQKSKFLGPVPK
ncbi:S41 family peptidase [Limnohabitans sp.]|jgi:C-terminal processing protease CtpA/Prc|uniref:S41 family peptidase n=1 Tax=Limnohabitans sp. TaxID=1907725 RepID=UPI0037C11722